MFAIYAKTPLYDDRDAIIGTKSKRISEYAYETIECAWAMMPSEYDDEGQETGVHYFVADLNDLYRLPIIRPRALLVSCDEDIPF